MRSYSFAIDFLLLPAAFGQRESPWDVHNKNWMKQLNGWSCYREYSLKNALKLKS